jgi:hypothetical protein
VERAVEGFIAITALVVGASHVLRPGDWAEVYRRLRRCGRPGAFVNGGLSLVPGALVLAGQRSWSGPGAVRTALGLVTAGGEHGHAPALAGRCAPA